MRRLRTNTVFLVCLSVAVIVNCSAAFNTCLHAQTAPTFTGCGGANTNVGPCAGTNTWSGPTGNGCPTLISCNSMSNITYTFTGGSCTGTDTLPTGVLNCKQCTVPTNQTDIYLSTAASTLGALGCFTAVTGANIGFWGTLCILGCCGVTIGTGCITGACFAGCGIILIGAGTTISVSCVWSYCQYNCAFSVSNATGSTTACG